MKVCCTTAIESTLCCMNPVVKVIAISLEQIRKKNNDTRLFQRGTSQSKTSTIGTPHSSSSEIYSEIFVKGEP